MWWSLLKSKLVFDLFLGQEFVNFTFDVFSPAEKPGRLKNRRKRKGNNLSMRPQAEFELRLCYVL